MDVNSGGASVLVLDAMGVIFEIGDDVNELLVPFARALGSRLSRSEIAAVYIEASLGRMSSGELWRHLLGGAVDVNALDEEYVHLHRIVPAARAVVAEARRRGLRVVCLSNDLSRWSRMLRQIHGLDGLVEDWIVSGEVGIRKPSVEIFEYMLHRVNVDPANCIFVDDRRANVEAAAGCGIQGVIVGGGADGDSEGDLNARGIGRVATVGEVLKWLPASL